MAVNILAANEEKYFKNADKYMPERWLKSEKDLRSLKEFHPFATLPFGFGARMCMGKKFVDLALEIMIAKVRISQNVHLNFFNTSWSKNFKYMGFR